jgi:hypothetical protein
MPKRSHLSDFHETRYSVGGAKVNWWCKGEFREMRRCDSSVVLKSGSDVAVPYSSAHNAVQQVHVT